MLGLKLGFGGLVKGLGLLGPGGRACGKGFRAKDLGLKV